MFLVLQFPFADARGFIENDAGRLSLPAWPLANAGRDFIRSSGLVRPRLKGGVEEWPGEELFGDASNAIKFPDRLRHTPIVANESRGVLRCAFRRFHSDGVAARFDVGFELDFAGALSKAILDPVGLIRQVVELNVRIAGTRLPVTRLIDAGDQLARHFLRSTTDRKQICDSRLKGWWFSAGVPSLVVESSGAFKMPAYTQRIMNVQAAGADLSHSWLQSGKQRFSTWFIERATGDADALRRLRIHLVRLHAERECLKCILQHIRQNGRLVLDRDSPASERIQLYLRDVLRAINKPNRYGNDQTALLEATQFAFGKAFAGETASLDSIRRQISLQVQNYIRRSQNVATIVQNINGNYMNTNIQMGSVSVTNGDFTVVTAENITNSFNKAVSADTNPDLKEQLKTLALQVAELVKNMPADKADRASRDLATLTDEAISKEPRKGLCEISGAGLIAASKAVAEMAGPISTAVKAVLALLP